jgi:hypothetical protein
VITRSPLAVASALVALPLLLGGCSSGSSAPDAAAQAAASAPVPGVTLPPDALVDLVPRPDEVPAGMVPVLAGSGPKDLTTVASYSGTGATATAAAAAKLTQHGFSRAYVAQYANPSTGQVLSIVASSFATAAGATADFADDQSGAQGKPVPGAPTLGEASSATVQDLPGTAAQLVLVRFRRGTTTWSLAYKAGPTADPQLAIDLATVLLKRTAA